MITDIDFCLFGHFSYSIWVRGSLLQLLCLWQDTAPL